MAKLPKSAGLSCLTSSSVSEANKTGMSAAPFVGVVAATCIFVGCPERQDFDTIGVPARAFDRVLTKTVEHDGVMVVFQHWLHAPCVAGASHGGAQ